MDTVIKFCHKYGYVALEEVFFRYFLLALFPCWLGVIGSGLLFGLVHYRFGWLSVIGCVIGGVSLGWLYLLIFYQPCNLLTVIAIHTLVAVVRIRYFGENKLEMKIGKRRFYV